MRITERNLRAMVRSVIRESADEVDPDAGPLEKIKFGLGGSTTAQDALHFLELADMLGDSELDKELNSWLARFIAPSPDGVALSAAFRGWMFTVRKNEMRGTGLTPEFVQLDRAVRKRAGIPDSQSLSLDAEGLRDLEVIRGLPLKRLYVNNMGGVSDTSAIAEFPNLRDLVLRGYGGRDLDFLRSTPKLATLDLSDCPNLEDVEALLPLGQSTLGAINIFNAPKLEDLSPLCDIPPDRARAIRCHLERVGSAKVNPDYMFLNQYCRAWQMKVGK